MCRGRATVFLIPTTVYRREMARSRVDARAMKTRKRNVDTFREYVFKIWYYLSRVHSKIDKKKNNLSAKNAKVSGRRLILLAVSYRLYTSLCLSSKQKRYIENNARK